MMLPRLILAAVLDRMAEAVASATADIIDLLRGVGTVKSDAPESDDTLCSGCGTDHSDLLAVLRGQRQEAVDAPGIAGHTWEPRFASEVPDGALIAVDGRALDGKPGGRALRVNRKKETQHQTTFGGSVDAVTFLATDVDSGEAHSVTVTPDSAIRVAFEVPDSASALGGEA